MTTEIRIVQTFKLTTAKNEDGETTEHRFQNYFVRTTKLFATEKYRFAPFQVQGTVSNLNGDNSQIQVLFPTTEVAIRLVEAGQGNRNSRLELKTYSVSASGTVSSNPISQETYIGLGATFSEDTVELRFNTAADSVASNFPARRLTQDNVGFLPLDSALSLR